MTTGLNSCNVLTIGLRFVVVVVVKSEELRVFTILLMYNLFGIVINSV